MSMYLLYKLLHILSSVVLVGVGAGSAFYMLFTLRTRNIEAIAAVSRLVVVADWCFTTPAILVQPLTGYMLMRMLGVTFETPWIQWTLALYLLTGICWLPVVWLQIRLRDMACAAQCTGAELPQLFWRYAKYWELLGYPAFIAMVVVYYLMVFKPN
ncbi:MAG: DUF2269 domain-containing protein [Steroidobacteraceae bacterium]